MVVNSQYQVVNDNLYVRSQFLYVVRGTAVWWYEDTAVRTPIDTKQAITKKMTLRFTGKYPGRKLGSRCNWSKNFSLSHHLCFSLLLQYSYDWCPPVDKTITAGILDEWRCRRNCDADAPPVSNGLLSGLVDGQTPLHSTRSEWRVPGIVAGR